MKKVLMLTVMMLMVSAGGFALETESLYGVPFALQGVYTAVSGSSNSGVTWANGTIKFANIKSNSVTMFSDNKTTDVTITNVVKTISDGAGYTILYFPSGTMWIICYIKEYNKYLVQNCINGTENYRFICEKD